MPLFALFALFALFPLFPLLALALLPPTSSPISLYTFFFGPPGFYRSTVEVYHTVVETQERVHSQLYNTRSSRSSYTEEKENHGAPPWTESGPAWRSRPLHLRCALTHRASHPSRPTLPRCAQGGKGTYHYKIDLKSLKATPFGDMAEGMPECEGSSMFELEKAIVAVRARPGPAAPTGAVLSTHSAESRGLPCVCALSHGWLLSPLAHAPVSLDRPPTQACKETSGIPTFNYMNSKVTPATALWSACIGTAVGGGGGGAVAAAAPAAGGGGGAAAKAPEPEPEPEEEEEDMGFDLFVRFPPHPHKVAMHLWPRTLGRRRMAGALRIAFEPTNLTACLAASRCARRIEYSVAPPRDATHRVRHSPTRVCLGGGRGGGAMRFRVLVGG